MITKKIRKEVRKKTKTRIRGKISGSEKRPRVSIFRSLKNISVQAINDEKGITLSSASSLEKSLSGNKKHNANIETSKLVGKNLAQRLQKKGITQIVFDRNGFLYHGVIKALADSLRENGIKF